MHIRLLERESLPVGNNVANDRNNVANHFRPQAFLSEESFPSLSVSCSSAVILFFSTS